MNNTQTKSIHVRVKRLWKFNLFCCFSLHSWMVWVELVWMVSQQAAQTNSSTLKGWAEQRVSEQRKRRWWFRLQIGFSQADRSVHRHHKLKCFLKSLASLIKFIRPKTTWKRPAYKIKRWLQNAFIQIGFLPSCSLRRKVKFWSW